MKWYNPLSWFRKYEEQEKTPEEQARGDFRIAIRGLRKILAMQSTHRANGIFYHGIVKFR